MSIQPLVILLGLRTCAKDFDLVKRIILMKNQTKTRLIEILQEEFWLIFGLGSLFMFFIIFPFILNSGEPAIGLQIVLDGVVLSVLYALLALGFSLIYGIAKQLKLSLGGYYVIAAYAMYFLVEAKKIVPGTVALIKISKAGINIDGLILFVIFSLPIILIIVILLFLGTVFKKRELILLITSTIISGGGYLLIQVVLKGKLLERNLMEALLISLAVLLLSLAAWYLELPKREIALGGLILGVLTPVLLYTIYAPVVYLALMTVAVIFTADVG